jgi:dihydroorotate dehydrogenase
MTPERAQNFTFGLLRFLFHIPGLPEIFQLIYSHRSPNLEREVFGIRFPNPVGLAAGFDKNARLVNPLASLGFGFVEIGTVSPRPQAGNATPRLFRLPQDNALINRMGFNNDGAEVVAARLKSLKPRCIVGGNIGKNKSTPNELAYQDYLTCFEVLYPWVDYFVINISSPNTPGLRELQQKKPLKELITRLQQASKAKPKIKPILLKVAPDLSNSQLDDIIEIVKDTGIDGIVATNTTLDRGNLQTDHQQLEQIGAGGLSGQPLNIRSTEVIRYLSEKSKGEIPIVGVGGISTTEDVLEKLEAGASLVQVYTGFIYQGPSMVRRINKSLALQFSKSK